MLTPFQTSKLLKGDPDGYILGGYRILYRIAAGTFGKVYRAVDPKSGQVVAVKVLRKKHLDGEDRTHRVAQFEREGRIGLNLRHPNVVQILAVSQDPHTQAHFIVMEFVEGGTLRDILSIRKKIAVPDALRIIEECVDGLAHAYERGLTHRDIKPSNILVSTDGVAKLVDFGLAETKALPAASAAKFVVGTRGRDGKEKGKEKEEDPAERTLDYAGIEKATGAKSGDIRSDIYFLGHALFEMIAGFPLMERTKNQRAALEKRRFEMVDQTLAKSAPDLNLPSAVCDLISRSVALEPHRRFQTPQQFLSAIKAVPGDPACPGTGYETRREAPGRAGHTHPHGPAGSRERTATPPRPAVGFRAGTLRKAPRRHRGKTRRSGVRGGVRGRTGRGAVGV